MNIYQLVLHKNAQAIQDLDDYQVKQHSRHIKVLKEEEPGIELDTEIEGVDEIEKLMRQPTRWKRRPK